MPNTILLKGRGIRKERISGAAINPGHLVEVNTANNVVVHSAAASSAAAAFAIENELFGKTINDALTSGDQVVFEYMPTGAEIYARLAASAPAVVIGDYLESAGDGTLRKVAVDAATDQGQRNAVVARAIEAVDNSGGGTEVFIRVEIV